ncbi:MAG: hypothetical protein ACRYFS_17575 [Janthinobacterium lividum]
MKNSRTRTSLLGVSALIALGLTAHPAAAQTPAISFPSDVTGFESNAAYDLGDPNGSYSLGFAFTANSPVYVTALGFFNDPSYNPLVPTFASAHQVGLFQVDSGAGGAAETETLVASAAVTKSGTANGYFLYQSLASPFQLVAGDHYVLAGVTGPDDPYFFDVQDSSGSSALIVDPSITYGGDRIITSSTLVFPSGTDAVSEAGFFGPNMLTTSVLPVPEASTTVSLGLLLALGLVGLGVSARRRSHANL